MIGITPIRGMEASSLSIPVTPMLQQYYQVKAEAGDAILFFRLGDFYEMFDSDALVASEILDITLTSREAGAAGRIPMCGVPLHSAEGYVAKLLAAGRRVSICEQVQDPKEAKGLVKREIIRTVSPGTVMEPTLLDEKRNNYLVSVVCDNSGTGIGFVDITTGAFSTTQLPVDSGGEGALAELVRLRPSEILIPDGKKSESQLIERYLSFSTSSVTKYAAEAFSPSAARRLIMEHFGVGSLDGFGCGELPLAISAAGALLRYVKETQRSENIPIPTLKTYNTGDFLAIDASSRRNLELTHTMRDGSRKGSLIWVLDRTRTPMGSRMLRRWLEQPLVDPVSIHSRQDMVEELYTDRGLREELAGILNGIGDLERLSSRAVFGSANGRDLISIASCLDRLSQAKSLVEAINGTSPLAYLCGDIDTMSELMRSIRDTLLEDQPFSVREGGMVREGIDGELDRLRDARANGKFWISELEQKERVRTGIKSLKISFNQVFGYYIEITKSNLTSVPQDYIRKQTLANAERYITPELKEQEELILGADERIRSLEYGIFQSLREQTARSSDTLLAAAGCIGELDTLLSLAEVAERNGYVKPEVNGSDRIRIEDGRHPVVEAMLVDSTFVPNSCLLDKEASFAIITGPNMAGKSTYIRQVALITLMAQMGSFVPASKAEIGTVDRIFTRVGASDDLATGRSTFMVELSEVANILNHATSKSLVILDEIGRGTSTFDGLSIAWAVTEYLHNPGIIGAKTLFATHYHELTELERILPGVRNYSVAIKQVGEDIVFLRRIVRGGAGRSFGIEVAKLAGLPQEVVDRAREILMNLEQTDDLEVKRRKRASHQTGEDVGEYSHGRKQRGSVPDPGQLGLFRTVDPKMEALLDRLINLDTDNLTPVKALLLLADLQDDAKQAVKSKDGEGGAGVQG